MSTPDFSDRSLWDDGWQTRDGRPVRVLANDLNDTLLSRPIVIAIREADGREWCSTVTADGKSDASGHHWIVRRPVKHKGWFNLYRGGYEGGVSFGNRYPTREAADKNSSGDRIACIEIEFEEGQGLT